MGAWVTYPDIAGSTFLWSVSTLLPDYTISHHRTQGS